MHSIISLTSIHQFCINIHRYLLGTLCRGLFFPTGSLLQLYTYNETNQANCSDIRKSTTSWCMFFGNARNMIVSKSSTEIQYRAMSATYFKIIQLYGLLTELGFFFVQPTHQHINNTSSIRTIINHAYHERMKHIKVDCHSIQKTFAHQVITLPHITTTLQISDIFTRFITCQRHYFLVRKLMLVDLPTSI